MGLLSCKIKVFSNYKQAKKYTEEYLIFNKKVH